MKTTPRIGTIDGLIGCVGGGRGTGTDLVLYFSLQDFHNWARTERTHGHTAHTAHTAHTFRYTLEVGVTVAPRFESLVTVVGRVITLNKAGSFEGRKGAMRKMLYVLVS